MASDTNIKKRKTSRKRRKNRRTGPRRSVLFSRLARAIFISNLVGLAILIAGSMAMNRFTSGLIDAKIDNLQSQAELITSVMGDTASGIGLAAELDVENAKSVLRRMSLPDHWRVRLHDGAGSLIADSEKLDDDITITSLDPILPEMPEPTRWETFWSGAENRFNNIMHDLPWRAKHRDKRRRDLQSEIKFALEGDTVAGEKFDINDELIVSVSMPVKRVQQVLGVVTLESSDVDNIVNAERRALAPIIGLAFVASLLSSISLIFFIASPIRRLARAAEIVTRSSDKRDAIPNLSRRKDEIGDLSVVMQDMTKGLYNRIDDIANFAADVAHEIKNPLTSLRSASDTLRNAKTEEQRNKLIDIVQNDVARMDRLITDISKASKVDSNLAKETAETFDINQILGNLAEMYNQTSEGGLAKVAHMTPQTDEPIYIRAFEIPFAQVLRNLIDNALTFTQPNSEVRVSAVVAVQDGKDRVVITVDDDGPGIPPDNLETVFERFYTQRPKGAQFGSHSGLGLAICRQIVTAHKGTIKAENILDGATVKGARFTVSLPRQTQGGGPEPQKRKRR